MNPIRRTSLFCLALTCGLFIISCRSLTISMNDQGPTTFDFSTGRFAEGPKIIFAS
jgi:hypothetical protein